MEHFRITPIILILLVASVIRIFPLVPITVTGIIVEKNQTKIEEFVPVTTVQFQQKIGQNSSSFELDDPDQILLSPRGGLLDQLFLSPGFFCASLGVRVGIDKILCKTHQTLLFCSDYQCICGFGVFYPKGIRKPLYTVWDKSRKKCLALKGSICGRGSGHSALIECIDNLPCITNTNEQTHNIFDENLRLGGFGVCRGSTSSGPFNLLLMTLIISIIALNYQ